MGSHRVAIADYGSGNIASVVNALLEVGASPRVVNDPRELETFDRVIVPGVGAFEKCMQQLKDSGLDESIRYFASLQRPILGICVGMQILFQRSSEFGQNSGLEILSGEVRQLPNRSTEGDQIRLPNIGWRELMTTEWADANTSRLNSHAMYFAHSYSVSAPLELVSAHIDFGGHTICAAVQSDALTGVQFHPERSGPIGLKFLRSFCFQS